MTNEDPGVQNAKACAARQVADSEPLIPSSSLRGSPMTGGSMTKAELVEEVSRVSDLTKKHSEVIVDTVFKSIIDALHRGEKIELRGFGSFRLRKREPRKGRNPKTGDKVDVPPKKVPYFKPGKELKELINREPELQAVPPGAPIPPDALAV